MPELVVLLRGDGTEADRQRTIDALRSNTSDLDVCLCDANVANGGPALEAAVARRPRVLVVGSEAIGGAMPDQLAWHVLQRAPEADVVLLELGTTVAPEWHERLRAAAYADGVIATSSAVPVDMLALDDQSNGRLRLHDVDSARSVALGGPLWGCLYVRRDALNVARGARGPADEQQDRLEEVILVPGLVHVLATAIVVGATGRRQEAPGLSLTPAVRRALADLEAALEPLRVTVDLRCCAFPLSGTQVHALNLVTALAERDELRLSVLFPAVPDESVRPHLDALPSSVPRHIEGERIEPMPHVFHRPYQVLTESEIADVVTAGVRLVVTHQDMILDRTPAYFASRDEWRHYAATTAATLVAADEVAFFSEHAQREAVRDGLVDRAKVSVVAPGTDHLGSHGETMPPSLSADLPFLFVIGNAYAHKNRLFALRVTEELRSTHGWEGAVVFAGGDPGDGSSRGDERGFLREHGELSERFVEIPRVSDAERQWLYGHAALVLFPTLYEGFGLIPFEAAAAGTACVYSSRSSVAEYLPPVGALLELGDVIETARRLIGVLASADAADEIVRAIRTAGAELTWSRAAESYVEIYRRAMTRPVGLSLVAGREVVVGARASMVSNETERRLLVALRRSAAVRLAAQAAVGVVVALRRLTRLGRRR